MINIVFSSNLFLSLVFLLCIIILYGLKFVRPELSKDEDLFCVTIGLFYSGILAVHGWRLDPILIFSQALIIGLAIILGYENIRLRGINDNQKNKLFKYIRSKSTSDRRPERFVQKNQDQKLKSRKKFR